LTLEMLVLDSDLSIEADRGDERNRFGFEGDDEYFGGASGRLAPRPMRTWSEAEDLPMA
jgi:hypothetical protein